MRCTVLTFLNHWFLNNLNQHYLLLNICVAQSHGDFSFLKLFLSKNDFKDVSTPKWEWQILLPQQTGFLEVFEQLTVCHVMEQHNSNLERINQKQNYHFKIQLQILKNLFIRKRWDIKEKRLGNNIFTRLCVIFDKNRWHLDKFFTLTNVVKLWKLEHHEKIYRVYQKLLFILQI